MLTQSGTNITATGVILESTEKITENLSIPSDAQTGPWQVVVEQNGQVSEGNATFTIVNDITTRTVVLNNPANNVK